MAVAVQRPRQQTDDLTTVLRGLQVVSGVLNIKDQLGQAERLKAQQERQAQLDAMQQERFAMEKEQFGLAKSAAESPSSSFRLARRLARAVSVSVG